MNVQARAVIYNSDLVKDEDAPTTFDDLLDPKWKDKVVGPANAVAIAMGLGPIYGKEKTVEWLDKMVNEQNMGTLRTLPDVPARVATGEYLIGFGLPANVAGLVDKGAPIKNAPMEKIVGQPSYSVVLAGSEHPNAAALLAYFMTSTPEGRAATMEAFRWADFETEGSELYDIGKDGRGVIPTAEWELTELGPITDALNKVLGVE